MLIRLAENFRTVFYAPFYATLELGHYHEEGLDVQLITSPAPGAATAGLLDGTIDVTWGGPMRVMRAREEPYGLPLVCFCEVVRKDPFFLVGKRTATEFKLTDLTKLRFASVSEVPTPWLCLQHDLRLEGIDPSRLDRVADRTMPRNLQALDCGEIDVAQMFEPYASMALRQGIGEILHAASGRGFTSYTTLLATRASVDRLRHEFEAMSRAIGRTQSWLVDHSAVDLAAVIAPYFIDVASEDLVSSLKRYMDAALWSLNTAVTKEGFERLAASLRTGGFISRAPSYEDCVADVRQT